MDIARRNILTGRRPSAPHPLRPPGAIPEGEFILDCTACGDCIDACPQSIVIRGSGGLPVVDLSKAECTFCGECIAACPEAVLQSDNLPWKVTVQVLDHCLTKSQVVCRSCGDACEIDAIAFRPRLGRVASPAIDEGSCTGCGACVAACPERALEVIPYG